MADEFGRDFPRDISSSVGTPTGCAFPKNMYERVRRWNIQEAYRITVWVYACVNAIAESIAGVPFSFYDAPPDDKSRKKVDKAHPANKLFDPPKPLEILTREDYVRAIYVNLGTFGEVFSPLLMAPGAGKKRVPLNIDISNPSLFKAIRDKDGTLKGWRMKVLSDAGDTGKEVVLAPGEVVQYKYYDPYNKFRGLTPLAPGRLSIEQDINMSVWNAGFFQNGVRNPIVIILKNMLGTGINRQQYMQQLRNDYSGFVKGQGPLVLEGGADARPLLQSIKDLDFIEGKHLTREEICALFGVPPSQVGILRDANYGSSREQTKMFWVNTLIPKMRVMRSVIQTGILDLYWPGVYMDWDWENIEAVKADPVTLATTHNLDTSAARNLYEMGYTKMQIADILDNPKYEAEEEEDEPAPEGTPTDDAEDEAEGETEDEPVTEGMIISRSDTATTIEVGPALLARYARLYQGRTLDSYCGQYSRFVKTFAKAVVAEAAKGEDIDQEKWRRQWVQNVRPILRNIFYAGVRRAMTELRDYRLFDHTAQLASYEEALELTRQDRPDESLDFFAEATAAKSFTIVGTITGMMRSAMANKLSENQDAFILPLIHEAEARWVVGRVYHHGRIVAQSNMGVAETAWAGHRCPIAGHAKMSGTSARLWADFPGEGIHPLAKDASVPLHVCTCTTVPTRVFALGANLKEDKS